MHGLESARGNKDTTDRHQRFGVLKTHGDRSIQEEDFVRIQIDRGLEMEKWAGNIKNVQGDERIKLAIVAANNHYAGFGPGTMNIFRNMLGLPEAKWEEKEEKQHDPHQSYELKQRSMSDFLS